MRKLIFGLVLFFSGVVGIGLSLIANGATRAGLSSFITEPYGSWIITFIFIGVIGLIISIRVVYFINETKK